MSKYIDGYRQGKRDAASLLKRARELGEQNGARYWERERQSMPYISGLHGWGEADLSVYMEAVYRDAFNRTADGVRAELKKLCGGDAA